MYSSPGISGLRVLDDRLVQPRRQRVDQLERARELGRLALGDARRDEDAEVADLLVQAVDDGLLVQADVLDAAVEVGDPVERLLRRGDVVAPRSEHDDRRADVAEIDAVLAVERLDLADGELVADEEVLRDPLHLLLVHEVVAAPPLLELEEALALGVDLRVEVVQLAPVGVGRIEVLEVVDEVGAVELAVPEVARHRGHPRPAHQPARVAHRVLAGDAGPVGDRRAGEQDRPDLAAARARRASSAPSRPGSCR